MICIKSWLTFFWKYFQQLNYDKQFIRVKTSNYYGHLMKNYKTIYLSCFQLNKTNTFIIVSVDNSCLKLIFKLLWEVLQTEKFEFSLNPNSIKPFC